MHSRRDVLKLSALVLPGIAGGAPRVSPKAVSALPPEKIDAYPDPQMFGVMPAQGFFLRHVKNLELSHIEIAAQATDERPSFVLEDVNRGDFIALTAPHASPALDLRSAHDFRVRLSRAAVDHTLPEAKGVTI